MRIFSLLTALALPLSATEIVYETFESDGYGEWAIKGSAFGKSPSASRPAGLNAEVVRFSDTYYVTSAHGGDKPIGSLTSPEFKIQLPFIGFLVSGGPHKGKTGVQLLIDDKVVLEANGKSNTLMEQIVWDVKPHLGKQARLRILDNHTGSWGVINADHFVFSDTNKPRFPKTSIQVEPETLVATNAIAGFQIPQNTTLKVFADNAEHGVYSPTALTVDPKGHVYVSETHRFRYGVQDNRDHLYWLMDDIASQTTDDRVAMHEKWKEKVPLKKLTNVSEVIRVLVDTDGDGHADKSEIFADRFNDLLDGTAAGIMSFDGKLYFACIPNIWSLEDKDGDLKADDRKILQAGFGVRVSFSGHDLNGFTLGPDGRLYTTVGDRGFSFTTQEGREYKFPNQGAILRFEPDGSSFEVVHTGLRNPKEIAFDEFGTGISVDNNSDQKDRARVVVMTDGADSGWRMGHQVLHSFHKTAGIPKRPINQWMKEKMWEPQNPVQPGHILPPIANLSSGPSGLAYHPGTGYDEKSKGKFLICDYRGSAAASGIWHFGIKPKGAGFAVGDYDQFAWGAAITDLEWGYDGKLYLSDFVSGWQSHKAGRILTMESPHEPNDVADIMANTDWKIAPASTLAQLMRHADQRIRLRAQYHLSRRPEGLAFFTAAANQQQSQLERLHGTWGLGILARRSSGGVGQRATDFLIGLLTHQDPKTRGQAAQALGESSLKNAEFLIPLLEDPEPRVQALATLAISRLRDQKALPAILQLIARNADKDAYLRHAGVMGLVNCSTENYLAGLHSNASAPVRRSAVLALRRLGSEQLITFLGDNDSTVIYEVIRAIHDTGMEGARPAIAAMLDEYTAPGSPVPLTRMISRRLIYSAYRVGTAKNLLRVMKVVANPSFYIEERRDAMRLLSQWIQPHVVDQSLGKYSPLPARDPAMVERVLTTNLAILIDSGEQFLAPTMWLVQNLRLKTDLLDAPTLTRIIQNKKLAGTTRAAALKLFLQRPSENASEILTEAAESPDNTLASTALSLAAERDPAANVAALRGAIQSDSQERRQQAWKIIGALPAEFAIPLLRDGLTDLTAGKGNASSDLDLLLAARSREEPAIKSSLKAYEKSLSKDDPLAKWRSTLAGGNAKNGFQIFQSHGAAQCMRCHRHEGGHSEGGNAGPNLMGVALRHDAPGLLESLMLPHAKIATGYGVATLSLKDGSTKGGLIIGETKKHLDVQESENSVWRIKRSDLAEEPKPVSGMPTMAGILNLNETRDLLAWLLTLTKENGEKAPAYTVKKLTLASTQKVDEVKEEKPTSKTSTTPTEKVSEENQIDEAVMAAGKGQYFMCAACHGQNGEGLNGNPPLANSEWVMGPVENLIRIQMRGLQGPIEVAGKEYNLPGMMGLGAGQSDENVAAVITYIRNSFGNKASVVTPEMVTPYRDEAGKPQLFVKDLVDPKIKEQKSDAPKAEVPSGSFGAPSGGLIITLVIVGLSILGAIRMKAAN